VSTGANGPLSSQNDEAQAVTRGHNWCSCACWSGCPLSIASRLACGYTVLALAHVERRLQGSAFDASADRQERQAKQQGTKEPQGDL
jgi:hypothetical protein